MALDPNTLAPMPGLAVSVVKRDAGVIDIELDKNARFHGGKALDATDVCATLKAIAEPGLMSPHRSIVETFTQCTPEGPHHLQLTLSGPRASYLSDLEIPILRADQARLPQRADGTLDGLGPFRVESNVPGAIRFAPIGNGTRPPPRFPLVVRTVHDENARAMRLVARRTEVAPNAFSPSLLRGLDRRDPDIVVTTRPGANVTYLLTRCDRPPLDHAEVRRALSLAIDREAIVMHLLAGMAQAAKWLIPDGHWAAPTDLPKLGYDPAEARRLLSALPQVTLLTSTDRTRVLLARAVGQMLSDAGLATQVVPLELGLLLSRLDAGQFTMAILQIPELTEPNLLNWFFHPLDANGLQTYGKNRSRYQSAVAAKILDQASSTFDVDERHRLYVELAHVMLSDMPVIPLWHEDQIVVARGRGKRFMPSAEGRWSSLADL